MNTLQQPIEKRVPRAGAMLTMKNICRWLGWASLLAGVSGQVRAALPLLPAAPCMTVDGIDGAFHRNYWTAGQAEANEDTLKKYALFRDQLVIFLEYCPAGLEQIGQGLDQGLNTAAAPEGAIAAQLLAKPDNIDAQQLPIGINPAKVDQYRKLCLYMALRWGSHPHEMTLVGDGGRTNSVRAAEVLLAQLQKDAEPYRLVRMLLPIAAYELKYDVYSALDWVCSWLPTSLGGGTKWSDAAGHQLQNLRFLDTCCKLLRMLASMTVYDDKQVETVKTRGELFENRAVSSELYRTLSGKAAAEHCAQLLKEEKKKGQVPPENMQQLVYQWWGITSAASTKQGVYPQYNSDARLLATRLATMPCLPPHSYLSRGMNWVFVFVLLWFTYSFVSNFLKKGEAENDEDYALGDRADEDADEDADEYDI